MEGKETSQLSTAAKSVKSTEKVYGEALDNCAGANTSKIIPYQESGQSYIEKHFTDKDSFQGELNQVRNLQKDIEDYHKYSNEDMPIFANYHRHSYLCIDYKMAEGESLTSFFIRAAITGIPSPDHKFFALEQTKKAGETIANYHLHHRSPDNQEKFMTSVHGDLHPANVYFEFNGKGLVTFIDYSSLSFSEKRNIIIDIDKLFNHDFNVIRTIPGEISLLVSRKLGISQGPLFERELAESLAQLKEFRMAFLVGYNRALERQKSGFKLLMNKEGRVEFVRDSQEN